MRNKILFALLGFGGIIFSVAVFAAPQVTITRSLEPDTAKSYWFGSSTLPYLSIYGIGASTTNFSLGTSTPSSAYPFVVQGNGLFSGNIWANGIVSTSTLIQFKGVASAGTNCLQIDATGLVTNTGSSCASSLSGGNPNAVAYWTSGTALAATSSLAVQGIYATSTLRSSFAGGLDLGRPGLAVGTATPGAMLSVSGDGLFAGTLSASNIVATSSLFSKINLGVATATPGATLGVNGEGLFVGRLLASNILATSSLGLGTTTPNAFGIQGNIVQAGGAVESILVRAGVLAATSSVSFPALSIPNATLANSTIGLTSSGSLTITGSPAALGGSLTVDFALGNTNTWTALQVFNNGIGIATSTNTGGLHVRGEGVFGGVVTAPSFVATSSILTVGGGAIGAGTSTPGARLGVKGEALIEGRLYVNNIIATSTSASSYSGFASSSPGWPVSIGATTTLSSQIASNIASTTAAPSAQIIVDWSGGNTRRFIISQNTTFIINATSSGPLDGGLYILKACEDHIGGYTMAVNSDTVREATTSAGATLGWVSTKANTCTYIGMQYDAKYGNGNGIYTFLATSTGLVAK